MSNPATQNDLKFFLTLCLLVARDLGFIVREQYGSWDIAFDPSGVLEKKRFWGGTASRENVHYVLVNPKLEGSDLLYTIAHEVIHLAQFMKGDAQNSDGINETSWKGKTYELLPGDSLGYREQPWEEEAYRLTPEILEDIKNVSIMDIMPIWRQYDGSEWSLDFISKFKNNLL